MRHVWGIDRKTHICMSDTHAAGPLWHILCQVMVPYCVTVCTGCCVNATGNFILCERQVLVLLGIYHDETIHFGGAGWRSSSSPALCTTEPGFGPGSVRAFGFQSILASAGFSLGSPVFFLHLKLGFLNKSVSGIIWSYSASLSADWQPMALRLESFGRYVARYKNPNLLLFLSIIINTEM